MHNRYGMHPDWYEEDDFYQDDEDGEGFDDDDDELPEPLECDRFFDGT